MDRAIDENVKPKTYKGKKEVIKVENELAVSNQNSNQYSNLIHNNLNPYKPAQLIIEKKHSDPKVLNSLRMFRPQNKRQNNGEIVIKKEKPDEEVHIKEEPSLPPSIEQSISPKNNATKFAPMLSTLNLNPKIKLNRVDDELSKYMIKKEIVSIKNLEDGLKLTKTRISSINIPDKSIKSEINGFGGNKSMIKRPNSCGTTKDDLKRLKNSVPGMSSMEFSCVPHLEQTVQIVQLSRNSSQSPNSSNTPPQVINRTIIQQPGTPSSSGLDSGVGSSPAAQTPPTATGSSASSVQDTAEDAGQAPIASPASGTVLYYFFFLI